MSWIINKTTPDPLQILVNEQASLDQRFSEDKTLVDVVSGKPLISHQLDMSGTNASPGTYADSDGLIRTSLVNLFIYSEQLDQWTVGSGSTVTPNQAISPDGTQTADRVQHDLSGTSWIRQSPMTTGETYTISVWAKAVTPGSNDQFTFNLGTDSQIFTATSDWKRFSYTAIAGSTLAYLNNGDDSFLTDVYFWGAQLEEGSVATDYIPTTNVPSAAPRFDHDPVTGESLGLLREDDRTNQLARSEEFSNVYYLPQNLTITPDQSTAPNGNTTADQVQPTTGTSFHRIAKSGLSVSAPCVLSLFVKANGYDHFQLRARGSSARATVFDLSNGTISQEMETSVGETNLGRGLTPVDYGDGWWRLSMLRTDADTITNIELSVLDTGTPGSQIYTFEGNGTSSVYCWGVQLEEGSSPTSYIPTTTSTATRAVDDATIYGTNFSDFYNHNEGTFYVEFSAPEVELDTDARALTIAEGNSNTGALTIAKLRGANQFLVGRYADGPELISSGIDWSNFQKAVLAYNSSSYTLADNGSVAATTNIDPLDVNANLDRIFIGAKNSGNNVLNGHIKRLTYFPVKISGPSLEDLTTY